MKLGNLGEQIVLISKKAFENIKFLGYEIAEKDVYYPLREERNNKARLEFLKNKSGIFSPNDVYLSDIMRGVIK
jgi:hypothetical protein